MIYILETVFGTNWRTTLIGWIKAVIVIAVLTPTVFDFLPADIKYWLYGICGVIYAVMQIVGGTATKDKKNDL